MDRKEPTSTTPPLTIREKVALAKTHDEASWNRSTQAILDARDGRYPPDWMTYAPALGYWGTMNPL